MTADDPDAPVRRVPDLAIVEDPDGERVALLRLADLGAPAVVLAGTAAAVWHAVDGVRTTEALVSELSELYAVGPDEIRGPVATFVADLRDRGLVLP